MKSDQHLPRSVSNAWPAGRPPLGDTNNMMLEIQLRDANDNSIDCWSEEFEEFNDEALFACQSLISGSMDEGEQYVLILTDGDKVLGQLRTRSESTADRWIGKFHRLWSKKQQANKDA